MGERNAPPNKALENLCRSDIIRREDWFLLIPVKEGLIKFTDLKDGSVNFRDVIYLNEMLKIQSRVDDYYRQLAEVESRAGKLKGG